MPRSQARIETGSASKYLQQLCKHFAHKVEVDYDAHAAHVRFPFGECRMAADDAVLRIECDAETEETLKRAQGVIDEHLVRFAWREKPAIVWEARASKP